MDDAAPAPAPVMAGLPLPGVPRPLDPRWITLERRAAWVRAAVWGGILFVAGALVRGLTDLPPVLVTGSAVAVLLLVVLRGQLWPAVAYRHRGYTVDDWGVEVRRGVLWRSVVVVPRSRVQHTDVSQGPFERSLGLATLTLHTAGTSHTQVSLPGLAVGDAEAIRTHLARGQEGDAV